MAMWMKQPTSEYASTTGYCSNTRVECILKQGSAQRVDPGAENSTTAPVSHLSSALTTEPFLALIILQTLHGHMVEATYQWVCPLLHATVVTRCEMDTEISISTVLPGPEPMTFWLQVWHCSNHWAIPAFSTLQTLHTHMVEATYQRVCLRQLLKHSVIGRLAVHAGSFHSVIIGIVGHQRAPVKVRRQDEGNRWDPWHDS